MNNSMTISKASQKKYAQAMEWMGNKNYLEAQTILEDVVSSEPNWGEALVALSFCQAENRCLKEAIETYNHAIKLDPQSVYLHFNRGVVYSFFDPKRYANEIIQACDLIPENDRQYARAAWIKMAALFASGDFHQAWNIFENVGFGENGLRGGSREKMLPYLWGGEKKPNERILLLPEQGLGDEILFASLLPEIENLPVISLCEPRLQVLLQRSFPHIQFFPSDRAEKGQLSIRSKDLPPFDCLSYVGSLAVFFRGSLSDFSGEAYLKPDPKKVVDWSECLSGLTAGKKIGFSWRSAKGGQASSHLSLDEWLPALAEQGIELINLQYDADQNEIKSIAEKYQVKIHQLEEIDLKNDIDSLAALMMSLDLVISPPTTVAILSGALGVKTIVPLKGYVWNMMGENYFPWLKSWELILPSQVKDQVKISLNKVEAYFDLEARV